MSGSHSSCLNENNSVHFTTKTLVSLLSMPLASQGEALLNQSVAAGTGSV